MESRMWKPCANIISGDNIVAMVYENSQNGKEIVVFMKRKIYIDAPLLTFDMHGDPIPNGDAVDFIKENLDWIGGIEE